MNSTTLTRKELYNLVWKKPLTHLAKEFGLSDNGIRKICKKHNIPLPKAGHWSKLKHGKRVQLKNLPKPLENPKIVIKENISNEGKPHLLSNLAISKKEILSLTDLNLIVPQKLINPDPLVIQTKEYFEKEKIRKKKGHWRDRIETQRLSIRVSENHIPRALRFMDTFIKLLKKRGHEIVVESSTKIIINEEIYVIRLIEKHKRIKKETEYSWESYEDIPTGKFSLKIDHSYPLKEWTDTKTKTIEEKLADILAWLEIRAKEDKVQRDKRVIEHKKWEEERERQKALQLLKEEEFFKFEKLLDTATRWYKSQYLRNYIKKIEEYAISTKTLDQEKRQWIKWAKEKVDWYDPFINKEVELLEDIDRETLKSKQKSFW